MTLSPLQARPKLEILRNRLDQLDGRAVWLLPVYLAAYFAVVIPIARRPLWHDELFTYYISMSRNTDEFLWRILHLDLNPPLGYVLVKASIQLFGDKPLAIRLPSLVAFLVASLVAFVIVRTRIGGLFGLTAMVLVWSCGFLKYAAEARPLALVLAFFALAFLGWSKIQPGTRFSAAHWGLSLSLTGMLLSHCFALFFVAPFFLGELMRGLRHKRFDRSAWAALLLPMPLALTYIPLIVNAQTILFPPAFQPSSLKAALFYIYLLVSLGPIVWVPLIVLYLTRTPSGRCSPLATHEAVFLAATLLTPLVIMAYVASAHVAFWPRYGIGAALAFSIGMTCLVAQKTNRRVFAASIAALLTLIGFCVQHYPKLASNWRPALVSSTEYRRIHPELPFVTASGITFLEMDHRESPEFVKRLYYLTDRASAIRYAHATLFEGLPTVCKYFPVRAKVTPYSGFVSLHDHFLVYALPNWPEDWLLDKLKDDGAEIRQIAEIHSLYRDTVLYEVRLNRGTEDAGVQ